MNSDGRSSLGRKAVRSAQRADLTVVPATQSEDCDCPACGDDELDPERMLAELVNDAAALAEVEDPLQAELAGAVFVTMAQAKRR